MFPLTLHSKHFIYGYMALIVLVILYNRGEMTGGNDLGGEMTGGMYRGGGGGEMPWYGPGHMVNDHSDSERGNPLPPHGLLFPISSKVFFYMHHPIDRIVHTTASVTPVVEHWLEREIAQWVHPMKDRSDNPSHHEQTLLPRSYISLPLREKVNGN